MGFAEDVDLWMGPAERYKMYYVRVPIDTMACGMSPWSCPNFDEPSGRTLDYTASSDASGGLSIHRLESQPLWAPAIWEILCQHGTTEEEDEGPVIFVNSFHVDHLHHPQTEEARPLRFDSDFREWERDIRFIWEDMIDPGVPLSVDVVRPDPPRSAYRGTVATVFVHQHAPPERAACLTTAVYIADPDTRFHDKAHSLPAIIMPEEVIRLSGAEDTCRRRAHDGHGQCSLHHELPPLPLHVDPYTHFMDKVFT